jgi:uncharacterized protein YjiS (DUF1127 family)
MTIATATANLCHSDESHRGRQGFLGLLLQLEAWLDARASRRALYRLDDRALADIGLSRADIDGGDRDTSRPMVTTPAEWR